MSWLSSLSTRDRRAMLVGAAIVVPALLMVTVIKPMIASVAETSELLAAERGALARERAAVMAASRNPEARPLVDSLMRVMQPSLFEGRDDVVATAELVSHLGRLARDADVWLQNATTRPTTVGAADVRELRVDIRAESDLEGLLRLLLAVERGGKLLRVERLDVSAAPGVSLDDGIEPLTISATITGFAIPATLPEHAP